MPRVHPDVQKIIVRLSGLFKKEDVSTYTGISPHTIEQVFQQFNPNGEIKDKETDDQERGRERHLRDIDVEVLFGTIGQLPDMYLEEMREMLAVAYGVQVTMSTVWRVLRSGGFVLKKLSRTEVERSAEKRLEYIARIAQYDASQLVFVDESAADRRTSYRGYAWSIRDTKAQRKAFFVRGRKFSVLPAVSLDGILHCDITEGSFCTASFKNFVDELLNKMQRYPARNSVIVMDKCRIHKHPEIIELIASRGVRCEFLPPHSPDFNPIELALSEIKSHLRRNGDYVKMAMTEMADRDIFITLLKAVYIIPLEDCYGWYKRCGYL